MQSFLKKLKGFCPTLHELFENARNKILRSFCSFEKTPWRFWKTPWRIRENVKESFPVCLDWHYLFKTAPYCKFDKNKCHVSNGLCANALWWTTLIFCLHIPFSPLKRFWKERFTAFIVSFCLSVSLKRETIFSLSNVYVYTCARINIKVCFNTLFPSFQKSFLPTSLRISVLQKSLKKPCMKVWWICFKALILHPLSREKGDTVDMLRRKKVMNDRLMKTFWNFFFKKFWWFKNLPYLCIRFPKESL